ncbi:MAG: UpxY family transcription antiterminator [Smithellaceae bacterium]|nr:UpxY family transcription antiterminator [Smithellaceae bacterium]
MILEGLNQSEDTARWYALHVRSRHEYRVREQLIGAGIEEFLPLVERLRRWKDRKKLVAFPLFPGYLFVHVTKKPAIMVDILKMYGVVRFLGITPTQPLPVPDGQIASLQKLIATKAPLDPYPYLKEGQQVNIVRGPLAGASGYLIEKRDRHLFVVAIDILKQGAAVKIDASDVEAC